jgi:hypothetical protein
MNTAEMWLEAQHNTCVYKCPAYDILYSKDTGLVSNDDCNSILSLDCFEDYDINRFMSFEWELTREFITLEEAEKMLGVKILVEYC